MSIMNRPTAADLERNKAVRSEAAAPSLEETACSDVADVSADGPDPSPAVVDGDPVSMGSAGVSGTGVEA
jgi:hypothetical protein